MCTPSNTRFLGSTRLSIPNGISISSAVFAQLTTESLFFTVDRSSPLKITPSPWILARIFASFLGPIRIHNPNDITIGSAVFAGITIVTNRPTDRQTTLLGL